MILKLKKGAILHDKVIGIIIFVIVAAIIITLLIYERASTKGEVDKYACHKSIMDRSLSFIGLQPTQTLVPLRCETENITIKTRDQKTIEKTIADAMYDCWWMVSDNDGNPLDFFSEDNWREIGFFGTSKTNCIICSTIKFDKKVKENPQSIDLMNYLAQNKIPLKNITYLNYFTGNDDTGLGQKIDAEPSKTDQDMAIIFMSIKGDNLGNALKREGSMIGGILLGGLGIGKFFSGFGNIGKLFVGSKAAIPTQVAEIALDASEGWEGAEIVTGAENAIATTSRVGLSTAAKVNLWVGVAILATITAGQLSTMWTSMHAAAVHCDGNRNGCAGIFLVPLDEFEMIKNCQTIQSIP